MALHNTQCPHCFTTYVITDEQFRVSEGMVRCGTCRERFQARLIDHDVETPRFDPREAFIEPISEDAEKSDYSESSKAERIVFINADDDAATDIQLTSFEDNISNSINSDLSLDIDDDAPVTPVDSSKLSAAEMLNNIRAKQAREQEQKEQIRQQELSLANADNSSEQPFNDADSELEDFEGIASATFSEIDEDEISEVTATEDNLIDEVDTLVTDKLLQKTYSKDDSRWSSAPTISNDIDTTIVSENADSGPLITDIADSAPQTLNSDFKISSNRRKTSLWAWFFALPLLAIIATLLALFLYQLWTKQMLAFEHEPALQKTVLTITNRVSSELEKFDVDLPVRRNLSQLQLLSARTEAHPTRSSTKLLKVDILNRAKISQPLPWLEMTLTDADGGLVSLRNLSPKDYIYNNNTSNQIEAKELKKITIELLSFPKQATGYELKLLNR